ncbi:MAG: C69 family dipeptidase [Bacteroidota bacterium]
MKLRIIVSLLFGFALSLQQSMACTNLIVSKGGSRDGSVMITYAADSHTRYGALFFYPGGNHPQGSMLDIYHYESGKLLGRIPEAAETFTVIGFMNDHQVAIGEDTWGGRDSLLSQPGAILDYGSLMKIGLQRSKTAREMIQVMTNLVSVYGYATTGESFAISDSREAWILELIGKGKYEKGAVWVARRVPDGFVSGHANQARITRFPFQEKNDWNNVKQDCYHSPDVISFARARGFYKGSDETFSFSDVYNPVNFGGARFCDARIWTFFRRVSSEIRNNQAYTDYAMGKLVRDKEYPDGTPNPNGFVTNRLPLWVRPDTAVTLELMMAAMRDHFEGTPLDMRFDFGAGPFGCPYRWRPMEFKVDSAEYLNERAIATQQTGYVFVAQSRSWLPDPIGGIFWFGVDDADGCVFAPMFCGITGIPENYAVGNGSMIRWSESSAYWTFSQVNNFAYSRYNVIHPEIEKYQKELENKYISENTGIETMASTLYKQNPAEALAMLTDYSVSTGKELVAKWKEFYHFLFMKYKDGNIMPSEGFLIPDNGNGKEIPKRPSQPGYGKEWERKMIEGTGDRLKVPAEKK